MKKYGKYILIIFLTLLSVLPLFACEPRAETADMLIPLESEMGEQEGFWLYKGDSRMRTDGSETQTLIPSVELNGKVYSRDEITVSYNHYLLDAHRIVFEIKTAVGKYAYIYDYEHKKGKTMCALPSGDVTYNFDGEYIYLEHYNSAWLFDTDGNLLCDSIKGTLQDGLLFDVNCYSSGDNRHYAVMDWWYEGQTRSARIDNYYGYSELEVHDGYAYFVCTIDDDVTVMSVSLYDGEVYTTDLFDVKYSPNEYVSGRRIVDTVCYRQGALYVLSYKSLATEYDDDRFWQLHKLSGADARLVYEFGNVTRGVKMGEYKDKFYFKSYVLGNMYQRRYKYDLKSGKMKRIWLFGYHSDPISKNSSSPSQYYNNSGRTKTVGKYKFYVDFACWGYSGFMTAPAGYCYYLRRTYGGETRIMQYSFDSDYFFDDICDY